MVNPSGGDAHAASRLVWPGAEKLRTKLALFRILCKIIYKKLEAVIQLESWTGLSTKRRLPVGSLLDYEDCKLSEFDELEGVSGIGGNSLSYINTFHEVADFHCGGLSLAEHAAGDVGNFNHCIVSSNCEDVVL